MRKFSLNIGPRLAIAFGLMSVLLVVNIGIGITMLGRVNDRTSVIVTEQLPKAARSAASREDIRIISSCLQALLLTDDPSEHKRLMGKMGDARRDLDGNLDFLKQNIFRPEAKKILRREMESDAAYAAIVEQFLKLRDAGKHDEAKAFMNAQVYPVRNTYLDAFGDMEHFYRDVMKEGSAEAAETYSESRILLSGIGAVALLGAIVMGLLITRSITRPLNEALNVAQTVAAGDLTSRIDVKTSDETGRLLQALKTMNGNLLNIVGEVRGGTHTIAEASGEVAAGSLDLSARTERQAASLEETASTMEELTSAVKQNAEHAREANALAETASRLAGEGGVMMTQLVETMGAINASSHRAVDIISVIDGIAFQTNILALNAAVEAARAGEQGRGFSVVASEVRNLAQRASQAAREIKELITASVSQAQHGNLLAEQAGTAIENIVASSTRVNVLMSEIAQAADEQTTGIEQINQAIAELDDVTQQNAALVEEASAAAQAVQDQAAGLAHAMSSFKLDHGQSELHVVSGSTQGSDYRPQFKPVSRDVARKAAGRGEARVKRLAA